MTSQNNTENYRYGLLLDLTITGVLIPDDWHSWGTPDYDKATF